MTYARPMPRKAAVVHAREVGDEIVVVAEATKQAHVLRGVTAELWRGLDSRRWPSVSEAGIDAAVSELVRAELVTSGLTRRALLARAGGVAAAAPLITIALPTIAMAVSGPGTTSSVTTLSPPTQGVKFNTQFTITVQ